VLWEEEDSGMHTETGMQSARMLIL
jgi:hypothetical protein